MNAQKIAELVPNIYPGHIKPTPEECMNIAKTALQQTPNFDGGMASMIVLTGHIRKQKIELSKRK